MIDIWILIMLVYSGAAPGREEVPEPLVIRSTFPSKATCDAIGVLRAEESTRETGRFITYTCEQVPVPK